MPVRNISGYYEIGPPLEDRMTTVRKLQEVRDVPGLIKALGARDRHKAAAAAHALGEIGDARAVESLLAVIQERETSYAVQLSAADALGQIGNVRAVQPLIAMLEDEKTPNLRAAVARALGQIGDARAVDSLRTALMGEADSGTRRAIVEALERIASPADNETRIWYAVVKRDWTRLTSLGAEAVELLIASLNDTVRWKRQAAAEALGQIRDASAVEPLIAVLTDIRVVSERYGYSDESMEGASYYKDVDRNQDVRQASAEALGNIGDGRAVEPLIAALEDNYMSGSYVAEALGQLGDARAVEPLIKALKKDDAPSRQRYAAEALGKIGDARALEPLIAAFYDARRTIRVPGQRYLNVEDDSDFRRIVVASVARFGDLAISPLIARLEQGGKEDYVREMAAEALGKIGNARAVRPLVKALKKDAYIVRVAAAKALGQIGDVQAVKPLNQALKDALKTHSSRMQTAAAEGLKQIGVAQTSKPPIALPKRGSPNLSEAVGRVLEQIRDALR